MRKFILMLVMLLTMSVTAQIVDNSGGVSWSDSLWNDIYVPDTTYSISGTDTTIIIDTSAAQTYSVFNTDYSYEWMTIVMTDTGTVQTDTVVVEYGIIGYIPNPTPKTSKYIASDTTWHYVNFMRDSSWTNINKMIKANGSIGCMISVSSYQLIRVRLTNANAVENRVCWFDAVLSKKRQ